MHWAFWILSALAALFVLAVVAVLALVAGLPLAIPLASVALGAILFGVGIWATLRRRGRPAA